MPSAPSLLLPRLPPSRACSYHVAAENGNAACSVIGGRGGAPTIRAYARRLSAPLRPAARFAHPCTADARGDSQHFKFKRRRRMPCQCSSAWLEHSPCKRKVVGSDPIIGFCKKRLARGAAQRRDPAQPATVCAAPAASARSRAAPRSTARDRLVRATELVPDKKLLGTPYMV